MQVERINKTVADLFVRNKHYSKRQGIFKLAFGLVEEHHVVGVAVFGEPPLQVAKHAFANRDFLLLELVRVVVQTPTKNAASFLVGGALRQMDPPCAIVSYADSSWGHCGIIYQATNWLYTGATVSHDHLYLIDGERVHPRTLAARGITAPKEWAKANGIETVPPSEKHRYVFLCGNKYQKRDMMNKLRWRVQPQYPKAEHSRYDDGEQLLVPWVDPLGRHLL